MKFTITLLLATAALLAGCASHPKPAPHAGEKPAPKVKPELALMPVDQAQYYRPQTPEAPPAEPLPPGVNAGSVTTQGDVHAYPVARYVDPANPRVMHERHVVYRRDGAKWRLDAPKDEQVIVGPTVTQAPDSQPMQSQEVDMFMREQQRINESNRRMTEALYGAVKAIQEELIRQREAEKQQEEAAPPRKVSVPQQKVEAEKPVEKPSEGAQPEAKEQADGVPEKQ